MKNITHKTFKIAVITAAVSAAVLFPFSAATAAEKTGTTKTHAAIVSQVNADAAAAVVSVTSTKPEPLESSILNVIKTKVAGKTNVQERHAAGVYVGKGLVLVSNEISSGIFSGLAKYRVTLADGRSLEATVLHEGDGLLFLQLAASEGLPKPVTVDTTHQDTGANVAVFGLSDVQGFSRHPAMERGYISAAFPFYSDPQSPALFSVKTDRNMNSTDLGPVFSRSLSGGVGDLIGMTVFTQEGESSFVPAEFFKPILTKVLASI